MQWLKRLFLLDWLPLWARVLLIAVGGAIAGLAVLAVEGCRASTPIVIHNVQADCENVIRNADGTVDVTGCHVDGQLDVESSGGAGDDAIDPKLQGAMVRPPNVRLN
jgi:hypothetical protein